MHTVNEACVCLPQTRPFPMVENREKRNTRRYHMMDVILAISVFMLSARSGDFLRPGSIQRVTC